jgi:hypothetical protein
MANPREIDIGGLARYPCDQQEGERGATMNTVRKIYVSDEHGTIHMDVPVGLSRRRVEVVVVWHEVGEADGPEGRGWPPGWFDATAGAIHDPTFVRPAQGDYENREELP